MSISVSASNDDVVVGVSISRDIASPQKLIGLSLQTNAPTRNHQNQNVDHEITPSVFPHRKHLGPHTDPTSAITMTHGNVSARALSRRGVATVKAYAFYILTVGIINLIVSLAWMFPDPLLCFFGPLLTFGFAYLLRARYIHEESANRENQNVLGSNHFDVKFIQGNKLIRLKAEVDKAFWCWLKTFVLVGSIWRDLPDLHSCVLVQVLFYFLCSAGFVWSYTLATDSIKYLLLIGYNLVGFGCKYFTESFINDVDGSRPQNEELQMLCKVYLYVLPLKFKHVIMCTHL
jgi:hypothetical protein